MTISVYGQQPRPLSTNQCTQFVPFGQPSHIKPNLPDKPDGTVICRDAYILESDTIAKIPVWVSYVLTPSRSIGCVPRSNSFAADQSLPSNKRADPKDYAGSGYDTGHIANNGDMSWNAKVEQESFILTNMTPQTAKLNRGSWKLLESDVRAWAYERNHALLIYAGPLYHTNVDKKIGIDQVDVPYAFYKIVVDLQTHEVLPFIFPAAGIDGNDLTTVTSTVHNISDEADVNFPLPVDYKESTILWPVDLGTFEKAKKAQCK